MCKYFNLFSILVLSAASPCLATNTDYDEEFNRAIAFSLQEQNQQDSSDEEFELAMALSLSLQKSKPKVEEKKIEHDTDQTIALALQEEEYQSQNHDKQKQHDSDYAFALSLQDEHHQYTKLQQDEIIHLLNKQEEKRSLVPKELLNNLIQVKKAYNTLVEQTQKSEQDPQFVHIFNKTFAVQNRETILAVNNALGLKQDLTPQQVIDAIRSWDMKIGFSDFENSVATLLVHLNNAKIDTETNLNVPVMISTCYALCKQLEEHSLYPNENCPGLTAKQYFVYIINENISEKGGCFPGFAGRLFFANIRFLCSLLGIE